MHERAAAPAGRARTRSRAHWNAAQAIAGRPARGRRELAVLLRQASCGARRASRSSSRPPTRARRSSRRRACARACGSASAGSPRSSTCSRRTSATSRRCCRCSSDEDPVAVLDARRHPRLGELRLHNGTIYRWNRPVYDVVARPPAPARREPRAARRPDRRRHPRQRRLLLRAGARAGRRATGRCGRRCRSRRPRRTSTAGARDGIDARVYWPGVGEVPVDRAGAAAPAAAGPRGARALGRGAARPRPAAGDHRAPLRDPAQRRVLAGGGVPPALRDSSTATTRCAR